MMLPLRIYMCGKHARCKRIQAHSGENNIVFLQAHSGKFIQGGPTGFPNRPFAVTIPHTSSESMGTLRFRNRVYSFSCRRRESFVPRVRRISCDTRVWIATLLVIATEVVAEASRRESQAWWCCAYHHRFGRCGRPLLASWLCPPSPVPTACCMPYVRLYVNVPTHALLCKVPQGRVGECESAQVFISV